MWNEIAHPSHKAFRAEGKDFEEILCNAALAVFSQSANLDAFDTGFKKSIELTGDNRKELFAASLNELLSVAESESAVFKGFEATLESGNLKVTAYGQKVKNAQKKELLSEILAVPYAGVELFLNQENPTAEFAVEI